MALSTIAMEVKAGTRRPDQRQFAKLNKAIGRQFDQFARQLRAGTLSLDEWQAACLTAIETGHTQAAALGRRRAGDPAENAPADALRAESVMREERVFFQRFAAAVRDKDPRYVGEDGRSFADRVATRSRQYLGKMRGTANDAFVGSSQPGDLFDRVMLSDEHCSTCPGKEGGPYSADQIRRMGYPGDGSDECGGNCGCVLVRYDGVVGFGRVGQPIPKLRPGDLPLEDPPDFVVPVIDIDPNDPNSPSLDDFFFV
jgi:hypothetical protein